MLLDVKTLFILNDSPYGTERAYNGLRLATALAKREEEQVRVFLIGDGVGCAISGQRTPDGYYNVERMLRSCARHGVDVGCCGSCLDARGIADDRLADAARRSSLVELADWTLWADTVLVF